MGRLTIDEQQVIDRIAQEPYEWIRNQLPEKMKLWDAEFFYLVDTIKSVWQKARKTRINVAFLLRWDISDTITHEETIQDISILQKRQNLSNSSLVYEIDLTGNIIDEIDIKSEIEPTSLSLLSRLREVVIFWLGPDLEIFSNGYAWEPENKKAVLREIKSKKRDALLSMDDHRNVLKLHFEQYVRDEARDSYWFKKNKTLMPTPEKIFQKSLYGFLTDHVDCIADREPMFKDGSRCDVRAFVENDLYFIEIKWVGYSVVRSQDDVIDGKELREFKIDRAIDGAYQTKLYIDKNNEPMFAHQIKLGIYLLYDAYPTPIIPVNFGDEINDCPLLDVVQYSLISHPPSVETKGIAKRKGLA